MQPSSTETERSIPAGFVLARIGQRWFAFLLDAVIVAVPAVIVIVIWMAVTNNTTTITDGELLVVSIVSAVVGAAYHTVAIAVWGRTVGKLALKCRVVRADNGARLDWWAAAIRALVPTVAAAIPSIGTFVVLPIYLVAMFDPRRQGIHDKAAGTIVVTTAPPRAARR